MLIRLSLNKTSYKFWKDRKLNINYVKVFKCKYFILNTNGNLRKFNSKSNVGLFIQYPNTSQAYRVYNKRTFDDSNSPSTEKVVVDDDVDMEKENEELQHEKSFAEKQVDPPYESQEKQ